MKNEIERCIDKNGLTYFSHRYFDGKSECSRCGKPKDEMVKKCPKCNYPNTLTNWCTCSRDTTPSVDEWEEKAIDILHDIIPHTPLKLSETKGTDYNRGYIAYQELVISNVKEKEAELVSHIRSTLQAALAKREREISQAAKVIDTLIDKGFMAVMRSEISAGEGNNMVRKGVSEMLARITPHNK